MMKHVITACLLSLAALAVQAQATPAGLWKTVDDDTGKEKSLVRISEAGGVYTGKVEKLLDPARQDARCDKCSDERKDQPVLGMTILRNIKQNAGDAALWDGGEILDPNNGKTYKLRVKPVDGGQKLEVRGYIGAPLLGRTQTWTRVE
ncbi:MULTISPECIES: DUF2147 domain-containing protein [Methylibium]|uniref:DUF2147 domain-containing protein n=1 Tax=Methylibium petroleiphilum (strain ATCC BAA-1232 / LMG 22953 / PM1) TaxID=420662 RepID=A2SCU1_METPP|nr:conserved hypothetical protein [Methylibium petroleiphilum PM1]